MPPLDAPPPWERTRHTGSEMKLLLIEDDVIIAAAVRRGLIAEGFTVDTAATGTDGLWMATEGQYDALIVDLMLPGKNGFVICRELRQQKNWTPILVLTAKDGELDEAEALDTGADDYLIKPFSYAVLIARLHALLRRTAGGKPVPLQAGDLRIDPRARKVWRDNTPVEMTARQFDLLEFLMRRAGEVVSKQEILDGLWPHDFQGDPNIVEVYIARLRSKVDAPFGLHAIETVRGAGYRLAASGSGAARNQ